MGRIPNGFIIFSPKGNVFLNSMTIFSVQFKILGNGISQSFTLSLKSGHPPFMLATHLNLTVKRKKFGLTLSINYFFSYFDTWMHWDCHELLPSLSWILYLMSICFFESFLSLIWVFFDIILPNWFIDSKFGFWNVGFGLRILSILYNWHKRWKTEIFEIPMLHCQTFPNSLEFEN